MAKAAAYTPQGLGLAEPGANRVSSPKPGTKYAKPINPNKDTGQLDAAIGKGPDASYSNFVKSGGLKTSNKNNGSGTPSATDSAVIKVNPNSAANAGTQQKNTGATPPKAAAPANSAPKGLLGKISTYGKALVTSPVSTVKDIATGQQIDAVDNGALILKRAPESYTQPIARSQKGNLPAGTKGQLDHIVPLEAGGTNAKSNLKLIPKAADDANNGVENFLGAQLKANVINAQQAKQLALDYKNGKITDAQLYAKAQKGGMTPGPSLVSKVTSVAKNIGKSIVEQPINAVKESAQRTINTTPVGVSPQDIVKEQGVKLPKYNGSAGIQAEIIAKKMISSGKSPKDVQTFLQKTADAYSSSNKKLAGNLIATASLAIGGGEAKAATTGAKSLLKPLLTNAAAGGIGTAGAQEAANPKSSVKQLAIAGAEGAAGGAALTAGGSLLSKTIGKVVKPGATKDLIANTKTHSLLDNAPPAVANLDANTQKSLNTIMSKLHTPKSAIDAAKAEADNTAATHAAAQQTAEQTQKVADQGKKLDNQIELINAKKTDGKFTNVDQVKIKQLKQQKVDLGIPETAPAEGSIPKTGGATPTVKEPSATNAPAIAEPVANRTLKPSETTHMPEIAGYTHSSHLAQDYADMLRGQEQSAKGGQMIKNVDGSYRRISEHSRFYRDVYKETGKAPIKADYLEEAKKQLENNKDGIGAGGDYKKLLEREAKPVPRLQIEPTVSGGSQGTSKVAQDIATSLKAKNADLAQYEHVNWEDQAKKAEAVTNNRELLDKVISGEKLLPNGLRPTALITAIEKHPELGKDSDLLLKVASSPLASESSRAAQELGLAGERVSSSPIEALKQVRDARQKAIEKRLGKPANEGVSKEVQQIRAAKPTVTKENWSSFIEGLKC